MGAGWANLLDHTLMRSPQSAAGGTFLRCHSNGIPSDLAFGVLVPDIREQPQSQLVFQPLDLAPELIAISGSGPVLPHTAQLRLQTTNFFHNQSIPCAESTSMISVTVQESCGSTRQVHSLCTARWLDIGPYVENCTTGLPRCHWRMRLSRTKRSNLENQPSRGAYVPLEGYSSDERSAASAAVSAWTCG